MKKLIIVLLFVFSLTLMACQNTGNEVTTETPRQLSENIKSFSSQDDLIDYFETKEIEMADFNLFFTTDGEGVIPESGVDDTDSSDSNHSKTNVQVEGVDEIDRIITDGSFIYMAKQNALKIIDVESMTVVFEKDLEGGYYSGLYLHDNKLVVIYNQYQQITKEDETTESYWWWWGSYNLMIDVYDVSDVEDVSVLRSLEFKNTSLTESRMIDGQMYLVMYNYLYEDNDEIQIPEYKDSVVSDEMTSLPYENIYYFIDNDVSTSYLLVGTFSLDDEEEIQLDAYLGYAFEFYMNQNNMYISSRQYIYDQELHGIDYKTNIMRFELVDKIPVFQASNIIDGWTLNQFSFDEHDGVLRVATTDYEYLNDTTEITNQMYFLDARDEDMSLISVLEGLGKPNERIYAVRMNGDIGYVVTFVNTDPLYKIDLSDPENPEVLGELYEEGVSDYLHQINDDLMVGIGRQAETSNDITRFTGVKVALYDTSEDTPVTIETLLVEGEYSYSPVTYEHKLFVEYEWQGDLMFAIPVYGYFEEYSKYYQAIYVYQVDETNGIEQMAILMDDHTNNSYYGSIEKVVFINDSIYTISYNFVVEYDLTQDFEQVSMVDLNNND
ncbi:MAG: beta-propeller domain-containing protein [Candidatus Izemoplasmatales bacterium]